MTTPELATLTCVMIVSLALSAKAPPGTRWVVLLTGLVVSAAMFLPSAFLAAIVGPDFISWLTSIASRLPGAVSALAHFVALFWLSVVIWGLRPDLRGWPAVGLLVGLSVFAELMQGIGGAQRSPRLDDVAVNLLGVGGGILAASMVVALSRRWRKWAYVDRTVGPPRNSPDATDGEQSD
jgi:VanZ family protein